MNNISADASYTIGELAKILDINVETIRFYQRKGLISQPEKPFAGYRKYPESTKKKILFIKYLQRLGFTLQEIQNLLNLHQYDCQSMQTYILEKQVFIQQKIQQLQMLNRELEAQLQRCQTSQHQCPIWEMM